MMGKRVNYAARTVLAPDGLLGSNEVRLAFLRLSCAFYVDLLQVPHSWCVELPSCVELCVR